MFRGSDNYNFVGSDAIELTKSDKRYQRKVENDVHAAAANDDVDEMEDDEQMSYGNNSDCDTFDYGSSLDASVNSRNSKLLLIISVVVASLVYTYHDDDVPIVSDKEEDIIQKVPYSYKGYKDARIPDDDFAQYGGELFTDLYGIGELNDNLNEGEQHKRSPNQQSTYHEHTGISRIDSLWLQLDGYAEMAEPYDAQHELPVFWHVPKSGGNTLQDLLLTCFGMIGANEMGAKYMKETLEIESLDNGIRYVNVDLSSPAGISNAHDRGFGMSGLADVIVTSWIHQAGSLFDGDHKGRCFTLLRHPVQRAISLFYYLNDNDPMYKNMSIEEYATSQHSEENWLVRFLNNEMDGALDDRHLVTAKEVLASKCLVGLMQEFTLSFYRFDAYFGWSDTEFGGPIPLHDRGACESRIMDNPENAQSHPYFDEGDEVWELLMKKNQLDMNLYEYAIHLNTNKSE